MAEGPGSGRQDSGGPGTVELPDLGRPRRIHVLGAGGSGMSAIAVVLMGMGHQVSGSDAADSVSLRRLAEMGADVHVGHRADGIGETDFVVRSTAIRVDNPEVLEAERRGIQVWRRADILAAICAQRRTVAVAGTHGKTTTSSLLAMILDAAGMHPSMIIGGDIAGIGPGARWDPAGDWFVVEADESDGTFIRLGAEAVVVTSVEPDHLDYYGDETAMRAAFDRFVAEAPGPAVLCADDPGAARLAGVTRPGGAPVITYGTAAGTDVRITGVQTGRDGSSWGLETETGGVGPVALAVPGLHNIRNATAAMAMGHALGADWDAAVAGVDAFRGVGRRFERRGERSGVTFIDDYGHLPTEVSAMVSAAGEGGWGRLVVVFQPHRYSRTEALHRDFADSFSGADLLIVTGLYPAGEEPRLGVSGELVYTAVRDRHPEADVRYAPTLADAAELLRAVLRAGDLCLTLGAGDLTTLPDRMLEGPAWS